MITGKVLFSGSVDEILLQMKRCGFHGDGKAVVTDGMKRHYRDNLVLSFQQKGSRLRYG